MADITGRYELVTGENYDAYLKQIGVGMINRTLEAKSKPVIEITLAGSGYYTIKSTSLRSSEVTFKLDQEVQMTVEDGRSIPASFSLKDRTLTQRAQYGEQQAIIRREFSGTEMLAMFSAGQVMARRVFKRV